MKLYWTMPSPLKAYFTHELATYERALADGRLELAWHHLERAHVLGQSWPMEHSRVHWLMLRFGFKIKSYREILGQLPRLILGGVKSWLGVIPVGNTGGADVPGLRPMPLTGDLEVLLKIYRPELAQTTAR
ncbi:MAG: DUF3703 domain-containing protein [Cyclobacteriaceae bacterium]|nr:DUF3703 domain-containing protein [Cyclobacteriaceae bacterium]